jgi:hypothetical protein
MMTMRLRRLLLPLLAAGFALAGCGTGRPPPLDESALAEAQSFPYYRVYWVGRSFQGSPLAAADGLRAYNPTIGDSVYYGDCVRHKGIFGGGSCLLPLQLTTVLYRLHSNATLGPQRNTVIRGVPATIYDQGRSIEIYTGRVAIDVFSDNFAHALAASQQVAPINAPGSARGDLPPPVYCPGLSGAVDARLARVLANLPGRICQRSQALNAFADAIFDPAPRVASRRPGARAALRSRGAG